MSRTRYFTGRGPRKAPVQPLGPNGPTFHDLRPGDRVRSVRGEATGVIVKKFGRRREA